MVAIVHLSTTGIKSIKGRKVEVRIVAVTINRELTAINNVVDHNAVTKHQLVIARRVIDKIVLDQIDLAVPLLVSEAPCRMVNTLHI